VFAGGVSFETNGVYPELRAMFDSFDPHQLDGTSWHKAYRRVAPDPDAWTSLVLKVCLANIPTVRDSPTHPPHTRRRRLPSRGARTDRAWRRATVLPSSRLPIARSGGSDRPSPCVVPRAVVRPLPRIQSSAEPGRHSFACPRVREDDPECKVSRDLGVGPRRGHLTARSASTQAAGRTKLGDTYWRRVDEVITRHVR
jgi:hypothetical protein